ncbi:hypothetical protein BD309DRAFT_1068680 [Dichomitus squalens]|nr:hypothetical protein BD309DRAFT_1068680 [Dichomitus squalens]
MLNHLLLCTKEMSTGHRHDVINDYYADFNVRADQTLTQRIIRANPEEAWTKRYLAQLEGKIPSDNLKKWCLEEVALLKEEMRRTLRFHTYQCNQWAARARDRESVSSGAAAYARKQVHRLERLINICKRSFKEHIDLTERSLREALSDIQ